MAASVAGPTRQDTYTVNVQITPPGSAAPVDYFTWDKMTGGEVDSDETKYNPGGMAPPVSLGGRRNTGNVVVSRLYRLHRDHDRAQVLINYVGRAKVVVTKIPMDIEGNSYGHPIVYTGVLKRVTFPEVDSEGSAAGMIEIEVTVQGFPVMI